MLSLVCLQGEKSIIRNLPIPNVQIIDSHSYISIEECISYFLSGNKMLKLHLDTVTNINKIDYITQSLAAKRIYEKANNLYDEKNNHEVIVILGIQWSDDCDLNSSINKH